jgi:hypothetical protein
MVLGEKITERLVGEFLEVHHAIPREEIDSIPGFVVKLHALA